VGRKSDLRRVDAVAREFKMSPETEFEFRDYLHECKESRALARRMTEVTSP
jgi:hypothetical protein